MKQIKKILVPTDFSDSAAKAFDFACQLAKRFAATITVVNVYRADFGVPIPETMAYQMLEARKNDALKKIEAFIASNKSGIKVETLVEMGFPADFLTDFSKIKEEGIDLIVMGTKGEHNLAERILGSVTSAVIRDASCPVLAIPENCSNLDIKEIAYACDLKTDQATSFVEANEIAVLFNALLHCVTVDLNGDETDTEKLRFNEIVSKLNLDIKLTEIKSDTLIHGLDTFIHENGINMLLMYKPQRSLFERIFHSSATKSIALHSSVPLLVFKK